MARPQDSSAFEEPQLGDYDYIRFLTKSRVAWEYLRRNRDYRRDWRIYSPGRPQFIDLNDGTVLLRARRRFVRAEAWGLCSFADPSRTGLEAKVFWRPEDYRGVVSAYVRNRLDSGVGSVVSLAEMQCRKTLLKTACGDQLILLRNSKRVAQLRCIGEDIRVDPFVLEVVVDTFPDVESQHRLIRELADIYRNHRLGGTNREWTVEALRHRDALVAFDLKQIGFIYRDIACFLIGEKLVREEWSNPNRTLKNRTIRNVKRGIRMVNGGYRSLLK